jgi:hypothetical protein
MYLLDTNIILELLLDQEQADRVAQFLNQAPPLHLHLTEFSLYSLGVILLRLKRNETFIQAVDDLLLSGAIGLVRLEVQDMGKIAETARNFALDFDDAYQYVAAEKYDLGLLSFDRTARGRITLDEVLEGK